ncbi:MAG: TIR domain-containing protein [Bacteroidales bacterium]|nr:TIR domain-containing protein [Bacteroidales bacterium]
MSIADKSQEVNRLIRAFEIEANRYYDIEFHTYILTQTGTTGIERKFKHPNHAIMLWQHMDLIKSDKAFYDFKYNLAKSDLQWGIRGAKLTKYGVIEGNGTNQFVKMAKRAGTLFSEEESKEFNSIVKKEIQAEELKKTPKSLTISVTNDNPLAIWLNYLLFYLSKTNPNRVRHMKIEPDLFVLSLLALEQLQSEQSFSKSDKSITNVADIHFKIAVSFPGEKRRYVSRVVDILRNEFEKDSVFYDLDYQAQIARPNADLLLQNIYHKQAALIVIFLCSEYAKKDWCGLEWRAIRDLIKTKEDEKIMFIKLDNADVDGSFSIDGYIDGTKYSSREVANYIIERYKTL